MYSCALQPLARVQVSFKMDEGFATRPLARLTQTRLAVASSQIPAFKGGPFAEVYVERLGLDAGIHHGVWGNHT